MTAASRNNSWVGSIHFPDTGTPTTPGTGQPSAAPDLTFTYYVDGKLATRTDARGVRFIHIYDAQGNRIRTWVEYPADYDGSGLRLEDKVERVELAYDPATGEPTGATAYSSDEDESQPVPYPIEPTIVAESEFAYNDFGLLGVGGAGVRRDGGGDEPVGGRL